uniref:NADH dehydrogenase subunit 6 n=1 Tax=Syllis sp. JYC-2022 TaxID=2928755 RepID=A0A976X6F2_9ANNE|nr:NADH dehydrogenase subunit 6 [Syllis sp. JYC-2022]
MLKITTLIIISMAIVLSIIPTPLTLGGFMLLMTILSTNITAMLTNSWLAMAIFLVYVGGLLVLFAYFLAIQPNQLTTVSTFMLLSLSTFLLLFMISKTSYTTSFYSFFSDMVSMTYIMSEMNLHLVILLGIILLLILVVVVKITHTKSGPLRPFM